MGVEVLNKFDGKRLIFAFVPQRDHEPFAHFFNTARYEGRPPTLKVTHFSYASKKLTMAAGVKKTPARSERRSKSAAC